MPPVAAATRGRLRRRRARAPAAAPRRHARRQRRARSRERPACSQRTPAVRPLPAVRVALALACEIREDGRRHVEPAAGPKTRDWRARAVTATEAVATIRSGEHVFIGTACATPRALVDALEALDPAPAGVVLTHFLTDRVGSGGTRYRHRVLPDAGGGR